MSTPSSFLLGQLDVVLDGTGGVGGEGRFSDLVWTGLLDVIAELGYSFCFFPSARRQYLDQRDVVVFEAAILTSFVKEGA